ncbi:MAG TPA: hypothetical protein VFP32_03405 [Candidatus Saccharimonadales bacterium]|nr:hypothetical protein [Candidatus Saccharimonadales bacterium]
MQVKPKLALAIAAVTLLSAGGTTLALGSLYQANPPVRPADSQTGPSRQSSVNHPGAQSSTKLTDAKLRACQNRQTAVNNIMSRIADRGQKQLNLFTTIAGRVETFYTTKQLSLGNYNALVSDVNSQKAAATTAVNTIQSDKVSFKCDGTDPHGAAQTFKNDLKSEISALQAYRTSVKNLIVGVKSVADTTSTQGGQQ